MEMRSKPSCLRNKNLLRGSLSRASFSCPLQATRSIASVALPLPAPTQISIPEGKAVCSNTFWVLLVPLFWKQAPWLPAASSVKEGRPGMCSSPPVATTPVAREPTELPVHGISLFLPGFFFLRFLLDGGKETSICHQLSLTTPGHHLAGGFVNPLISDLFQDEVGLFGFPGDNVN